jgi:hypothetical protein
VWNPSVIAVLIRYRCTLSWACWIQFSYSHSFSKIDFNIAFRLRLGVQLLSSLEVSEQNVAFLRSTHLPCVCYTSSPSTWIYTLVILGEEHKLRFNFNVFDDDVTLIKTTVLVFAHIPSFLKPLRFENRISETA